MYGHIKKRKGRTQFFGVLPLPTHEWETPTLDRFLEALAASMEGIESGYRNRGEALPAQPTWALLAELLIMATGYE